MSRPSVLSLLLVVMLSGYWVLVAQCTDFNGEERNNQPESDEGFLRMLREMLGFQQGGKRADSVGDFPSAPGFMGARGRRFSPLKRSNDISPPPGFLGARGKKSDMDDYADNYIGAVRG